MSERDQVGRGLASAPGSAEPMFQEGDKVRWRDEPRIGIVTLVVPPDAMVTYGVTAYASGPHNDVASVCCALRNLTLVARAVYLDDADVTALEWALRIIDRSAASEDYAVPRERTRAIITRAKRAEESRSDDFTTSQPPASNERSPQ